MKLGIEINNPGNIMYSEHNHWQGRIAVRTDPKREEFETPIMGLRALAVLLITHYDKGANTVFKQVSIWAPNTENDTPAYIKFVCEAMGIDPKDADKTELDFHSAEVQRPFIKAIVHFENGSQPYSDKQINAALIRAGVQVQLVAPGRTGTVRAQQAAMGATTIAASLQGLQDQLGTASSAMQELLPYMHAAQYALFAVTIVSILVTVWLRIEDHRQGMR